MHSISETKRIYIIRYKWELAFSWVSLKEFVLVSGFPVNVLVLVSSFCLIYPDDSKQDAEMFK
jgi:hypothetical protein